MTRRSVTSMLIKEIKGFILLQLLLLHLAPCCTARSIYGEQALQYQPYQRSVDLQEPVWSADMQMMPQKRRLVVRVPFAQNPEAMHLSRIYKSLFTQKEKKELGSQLDRLLRMRESGN